MSKSDKKSINSEDIVKTLQTIYGYVPKLEYKPQIKESSMFTASVSVEKLQRAIILDLTYKLKIYQKALEFYASGKHLFSAYDPKTDLWRDHPKGKWNTIDNMYVESGKRAKNALKHG